MDTGILACGDLAARRARLLARVGRCVADIAAAAAARDETASFPDWEVGRLKKAGALTAALPLRLGGLGFGTEPEAAADTVALLRLLGRASLPLGRVFEGHVNALRLICRLGTERQARTAAADAAAGHLFGVWNTDPADTPLRMCGPVLRGVKILASGAGIVTRALVTVQGEPRPLLLVQLRPGEGADLEGWTAQGMRASATGRVSFDDIGADAVEQIGAPGSYLAQPDFSGGAWRVTAVQLGGLDAVMAAWRQMLLARGRAGNAHQLARLGMALIAHESATLFVHRAAELAEAAERDRDAVVAYVGLARIAVETACLQVMQLAQRSIGLAAFMRPAPIERICRDLATYLRQPAPDDTLTEAAAHFMGHALP
jgi:alkylation response protein AidB-like acyl-CoA dehydrogenase